MVRQIPIRQHVLVLAFNSHISKEMTARIEALGRSRVTVKTTHSLGLSMVARNIRNGIPVDKEKIKISNFMQEAMDAVAEQGIPGPRLTLPFHFSVLHKILGIAMAEGYYAGEGTVPQGGLSWNEVRLRANCEEADVAIQSSFDRQSKTMSEKDAIELWGKLIRITRELMLRMYQDTSLMTFDEMLYWPVIRGYSDRQWDWVLVDEAQDLSRIQAELLERLRHNGTRVVICGDPHQACYAFRGARHDSFELLEAKLEATALPLSISFRCAQEIVKEAQRYVPHFQPAPSAPKGEVCGGTFAECLGNPAPGALLLARTNATLLIAALTLFDRNKPFGWIGRNLEHQLLGDLYRFGDTEDSFGEIVHRTHEYLSTRAQKLQAKGEERERIEVQDRINILTVLRHRYAGNHTLGTVTEHIKRIFGGTERKAIADDRINLSSIHRSKGLEAHTVYYVQDAENLKGPQETNLRYIATTRAKRTLVKVPFDRQQNNTLIIEADPAQPAAPTSQSLDLEGLLPIPILGQDGLPVDPEWQRIMQDDAAL